MSDELSDVERLAAQVLASGKYRRVSPALVRRIGAAELAKGRGLKTAVKATKNKLHQIGGAYFDRPVDYERALDTLRQAAGDPARLRAACREIMGLHASTRERLPVLEEFYATIFAALPPVRAALDVACGLNPLALPWMPLAHGATYTACDMYGDMVDFLNEAFPLLDGRSVNGRAEMRDVVGDPPAQQADLALVLKTLPVLAQVEKTAVPRLLDALQARYLLITFPVASLGGRSKGMADHYTAQFEGWADGRSWSVQRFEFDTELAFLVQTW